MTDQSMEGFDFSEPIPFSFDGTDYFVKYSVFTFDENVLRKIPSAKEYRTPLLNIPKIYRFPNKRESEHFNRYRDTCDMEATSFTQALDLPGKAAYNSEISLILQQYYESDKSFFTSEEFKEVLNDHDPKVITKKDMGKLRQSVFKYCTANSKFIARDEETIIPINEVFSNPFMEDDNTITISVFDIQSIGAMTQGNKAQIMTTYASSVTGQIFDYINKKHPPIGKGYELGMPKVWLIYDEAHNLLEEGKTTSNNNIKRIMQEGRSLGAFASIISQKPQIVDITARTQAGNKIYAAVTWEAISRDINAPESFKSEIKEKVRNSNKKTHLMTFINDDYPEGILFHPLTSPQCILAKTDILGLI